MRIGDVLVISSNRFQKREIESWSRKFGHRLLSADDVDGRVVLRLEKGSR
jgi:TusA-related sulfurtransferase